MHKGLRIESDVSRWWTIGADQTIAWNGRSSGNRARVQSAYRQAADIDYRATAI